MVDLNNRRIYLKKK